MSLLLAEADWNTLLDDPGILAVVAVWAIVGVVVLGSIIAIQWRKVQQAKHEANLKQRMIERGFTADEIVSVINAGTAQGRLREPAKRADRPTGRACCPEPLSG